MVQEHLERLKDSGLGYDVRKVNYRVEVVSQGSALCFITWEVVPGADWKGGAGWQWENCYFYRLKMDGTEGWEGVISDGEIGGLLQHIPDFFSLG